MGLLNAADTLGTNSKARLDQVVPTFIAFAKEDGRELLVDDRTFDPETMDKEKPAPAPADAPAASAE